MKPILRIKKLDKFARLPTKATEGSACWDVYALEDKRIGSDTVTSVRTGLALECPRGYFLDIRPRSGLAFNNTITIINSPGTLDEDYRGELVVGLICHLDPISMGNYHKVNKGDRIAQIRLEKINDFKLEEVNELTLTVRGENGFGSTGK